MGFGLYIHIPFCKSKCNYCDFLSYAGRERDISAYMNALALRLRSVFGLSRPHIDTVFIGGGTPTCLPPHELELLIASIRLYLDITDAEFTVEANPNTIDGDMAATLADCGVNRVSLGLQATQKRLLEKLGRRHSFWDYQRAVHLLRSNGIENLNTDLIYGIPEQTLDDVFESVSLVNTPHISAYSLKIEPGTPFARDGVTAADEEHDRALYHGVVSALEDKGVYRYEISNFAKPGFECRHNLNYWLGGEYRGIGLGAHSCVGGKRFCETTDMEEYIALNGARTIMLGESGDLLELLMLRLRLEQGCPLAELLRYEGGELALKRARALEKQGLLTIGEALRLTDKGFDLQDYVVLQLCP